MLQEQMWIKAGIGFTDSKREDAYVEDSGRFVVPAALILLVVMICDSNRFVKVSYRISDRRLKKKLQSGSACRSAQQILRQTQ